MTLPGPVAPICLFLDSRLDDDEINSYTYFVFLAADAKVLSNEYQPNFIWLKHCRSLIYNCFQARLRDGASSSISFLI